MKLIYRGTSFDYNPSRVADMNMGRPDRPHHVSSSPYALTYRGQTLLVDPTQPLEDVALPRTYELIYRGEKYQTKRVAQAICQPVAVTVPATLPRHYIDKAHQLDQIHQANLQENLQRRLKAAQSRGDQRLVTLLEAERKQLKV
ncbi:MAG: DUF4278 domain-containing protein [Leptolyngbyaceae cyanobacterium CSU_1_4]|nr:DUF4278 domain-containing protein [Leptolyngbyaceae cyanobacterium CSU_1_4]